MVLKNNKRAKEALFIGLLCSISYLAVYVARNVLSTVTPQMVEGGEFTKEYIGEISSLFFIFYALGQLLNGFLGDKIKARYMIDSRRRYITPPPTKYLHYYSICYDKFQH